MRLKYTDDKTALAQIDTFDWESQFGKRNQEIIDAANAGDFKRIDTLRKQLKRDFPDNPYT